MFLWCICPFVSGCSVKPCPVNTTGGTSLILKCEAGQYKRTRMSVFCWPILQLCRHHADWKIKDFMQSRHDVWLVRLDIPCPGPKSRLWDSWSGVQSTRFKACVSKSWIHRVRFADRHQQILDDLKAARRLRSVSKKAFSKACLQTKCTHSMLTIVTPSLSC